MPVYIRKFGFLENIEGKRLNKCTNDLNNDNFYYKRFLINDISFIAYCTLLALFLDRI